MYIDLLNRIKNAQAARLERVKAPYTNMDMAVAELLATHKFVKSAEKKGRAPKRYIEVQLAYEGERGAISGVKFTSVPSRKIYSGYRNIASVRQGFGIAVLTTPKGIMTGKDAKKQKVGGKMLFEIW